MNVSKAKVCDESSELTFASFFVIYKINFLTFIVLKWWRCCLPNRRCTMRSSLYLIGLVFFDIFLNSLVNIAFLFEEASFDLNFWVNELLSVWFVNARGVIAYWLFLRLIVKFYKVGLAATPSPKNVTNDVILGSKEVPVNMCSKRKLKWTEGLQSIWLQEQ